MVATPLRCFTLGQAWKIWRWSYFTPELASTTRRRDCGIAIAALKACGSSMDLTLGQFVHADTVQFGLSCDIYVATTLVDMYAKCGSMIQAQRVFDAMQSRNAVAWTALILGYAENGQGEVGLEILSKMRDCRCQADSTTFLAALKACGDIAAREQGRKINGRLVREESLTKACEIHARAAEAGCDSHPFVANSLISLYSRCGGVEQALSVFEKLEKKTVVSWTALMLGCVENGEAELALDLFSRMDSVSDAQAYVAALTACASVCEKSRLDGSSKLQALERGMAIHSSAARSGLDSTTNVFVSNTLVDMYSKCGSLLDGRAVFDRMSSRDVVSWNALLLGYAENGEPGLALELFEAMKQHHHPTARTFLAAFIACGNLAALQLGRSIHNELRRNHRQLLDSDPFLGNCIIDFYGKCGSMAEAREVFEAMVKNRRWRKDVVTWGALMAGYSHQGDTSSVLELFEKMVAEERIQPDAVTFLSILTACSHAGLVDQGRHYFAEMSSRYGVTPVQEHYHCLVDLLGRSNRLDEALAVVRAMPFPASAITWSTLLGACKKWKNAEVGKFAFDSWQRLDEKNATAYLLMASTTS
ncbi:pentatricopeptide repeat-containing protein At1g11290, chloroplastic-like [Selaginella moellendorffii]|uniref:pentatricopeptide repeat-containing protein At1g11290, chloroplastic-like n=1 Tax=Selaginella moellendorffii TaxID=88036 RepID=UPI000D1C5B6C|nr:pentatricopeptide repeat-containing protein At1g11290, chloroplastic-like [Selaginella moellendorffii]|eukprot:XP_024521690.1 pentatricopeptide repeat-containing protein At1g11290, chloroplastic-like [Selaginella moellendorffii]